MVTFARLLPMPLLAFWLYHAHSSRAQMWAALIVGTLIGCTDFVDGFLARKHGPTVLGGLLDPIADKVFVALIYAPLAAIGVVPAWACALMFVREFLVTALRSSYEIRGLQMKTSYIAKVKTWTQMQGIGVLYLFLLLADHPDALRGILIGGIIAPLVAMAVLYAIRKKLWTGALVMSAAFAALYVVFESRPQDTAAFIMIIVVALTWISGIDYFVGAAKHLRNLGAADYVRVAGAIALPCSVFAALVDSSAPAWPILTVLSLELGVGGLDNLLSHHKAAASPIAWGVRTLGASALLFGAVWAGPAATGMVVTAAAISTAGVAWEFWRGRSYYLDQKTRDKARTASSSPAPANGH
jgi:CDP-diacylglycerol--glycerol-3-phosphate 3-phosphatidyltransferase